MISLKLIAKDIRDNWKNVNYGAEPYLVAMEHLDSIEQNYGFDKGRTIVSYFLVNAGGFRGEDARRIKKELKGML